MENVFRDVSHPPIPFPPPRPSIFSPSLSLSCPLSILPSLLYLWLCKVSLKEIIYKENKNDYPLKLKEFQLYMFSKFLQNIQNLDRLFTPVFLDNITKCSLINC